MPALQEVSLPMSPIEQIQDFLDHKRVAMVGVSRESQDFSRGLFREFVNRGYDMVDSGKPIKFVIPTEGASIGMVSFHIPKSSPNADICKKFINFALSKKPQEDFGNGMNAGPTTTYAVLNEKARSRVPPIDSMLLFDWFKLVPQMSALADRWNREIAG